MIKPHGGKLINRILNDKECERLISQKDELPQIKLNEDRSIEVRNIANGVFSPLEGFMTEDDFISVLEFGRLSSDLAWTIPIVLDVDSDMCKNFTVGDEILLLDPDNEVLALLESEELYKYDKKNMAKCVFGTTDDAHPGVKTTYNMKEYLLGGRISMMQCEPKVFPHLNLTPKETRILFKSKGWRKIVAFQTRNPPHIGHEYVQKTALTFMDGIFINPVIGNKKKGDFKDELILACYQELIKQYYLKDSAVLSIFETPMRYAGPKEAIYHAIARKNFGCTHIIIGRDHAGVGNYYDSYAAHRIFDEYPDLQIEPLFFRSFYRCTKCNSVVNEKICPHDQKYHISFSGTKIRKLIQAKEKIPPDIMRPEIAEIILKTDNPFVE